MFLITLREGYDKKYENFRYMRNGFVGFNKLTGHDEGLPQDAFDIVPVETVIEGMRADILKLVRESVTYEVEHATRSAAEQIVDLATKAMQNAGNV